MPHRSALIVGSSPGCDLLLQGPGVASSHAQLTWREGLVLTDLGQGQITVDGRPLGRGETVTLPGWSSQVLLGQTQLPLDSPMITLLFTERSGLPIEPGAPVIFGRDPARAHVVVSHAGVSSVHAQVDVAHRTITDVGSKSGTSDVHARRLAPQQPAPLDASPGWFFGAVYLPLAALVELASPRQAASTAQVPSAPRARTVFGALDLSGKGGSPPREAVIGRRTDCDIVLPFPQLSARHASVTRTEEGKIAVTDLGSTNGTYARGVRLTPGQRFIVEPGERILVGPYTVVLGLDGPTIQAYVETDRVEWTGNLIEIEALGLSLEVPDRDRPGSTRRLLNEVTFKSRPGDLIALMGPSGAGKTTLLTVLNGYLRPSRGEVRVNGENLYKVYEALRGSIGYVPQDDIVHPELTVEEAIRYSARFRLPSDFSEEEITRRVDQVVKDLNLESVRHLEIGRPERKVLSGGQRKRVNIALELVTDPALLFLDEPTSGLAADDTVSLIDLLSKLAKQNGKTILVTIHQPAREEYEKFNLALIMGFGGEPVYYGPTGRESYEFFGGYARRRDPSHPVIDNPRDMFKQIQQREQELLESGRFGDNKAAARLAAAQAWRGEFEQSPVRQRMYSGARAPGQPGTSAPPTRGRVPLARQFALLLSRYWTIKARDRAGTGVLLAQAPIIGALLAAVFHDGARVPNLWCRMAVERIESAARAAGQYVDPACMTNAGRFQGVQDYAGTLFFLTIAAIWFGTSNAAREVVSDQAIYRRERMVNLSIFNYVLSKFTLLTGLAVVQCTVLLGIVFPIVGLGGGGFVSFAQMLVTMILTAMCATSIGLLLSTLVTSSEAAMALTPIALIPQVILGGRLVPMTGKSWLEGAMSVIPARWSFESMLSTERFAVDAQWDIPVCVPQGTGVVGGRFQCALEEVRNAERGLGGLGFTTYDQGWVPLAVMLTMSVLTLGAVMTLLKRRDPV
jgi:ABC-type multidrug transport system ATPase subunit